MSKSSVTASKIWKHFMSDSLYRNSIFLMSNTAASAVLSFGFWVIAARIYSTSIIGIISAAIAASSLLAALSFFGFDYALIKFIPGSKHAAARTHTGLTVAAAAAFISSVIYLLLVPSLVPKLHFLVSSPYWILGFIILVIATVWNTLTNSIFVAHRITQYTLLATIIFGLIRFPLFYILPARTLGNLFFIQASALTVGVGLCFLFLRKAINYRYNMLINKKELRFMSAYAFKTYLSNVSGGLPALILPTIILKILGSEPAAYFYIANLLSGLLYVIPNATGQSLLAEGNWDSSNLTQLLIKAAKLIGGLVIVAVILVTVFGWFILDAFGKSYAHNGYLLLILLSVTTIPKVASYLFSTVFRIHDRMNPILLVATIGTVIQLAVSIIGMKITNNLATLGIGAIACEIFVASSYTYLYVKYQKAGAFDVKRLS
jgi:O-antigen/teichoic acid export membrane protein